MQIDRQELLTALEQVRPGLAKKEQIEQSTHFAFMGGRVVTFNDEISVSAPVEGLDLEGAIEAQPLYQLLKRVKGEMIKAELSGNELTIGAGRSRAKFALHSDIRLPLGEVGNTGDWQKLPDPEGFKRALQFAHRSCSREMSQPVLTCVHLVNDVVESTDNLRLTRFRVNGVLPITSGQLIPATSVKELVRYNIREIAEGQGWLHFRTSEGTRFSCRVFQAEFPNIDSVLAVKGQSLDLSDVGIDALDRALIFAERDYELDEEVTVQLAENQMTIHSEGQAGSYTETADITYNDTPVSFGINPNLLRDILQYTTQAALGENRLKFEGEEWEHVIALKMEG